MDFVSWCRRMGRGSSGKEDDTTEKYTGLVHALNYTGMPLTSGELRRAASRTFSLGFLAMFFVVGMIMVSLPHITDDSGTHIQDMNSDRIPDILQNIKPEYIYMEDPDTGENEVIGQAGYYNDGPTVSPVKAALLVLAPLVLIPLYVYAWMLRYPIVLERRKKMAEAGALPEAMSYLIMALSITPSLERALDYASANAPEPLNKRLGKVLWDFFLGYERSFRASFVKMASTLGEINGDFKMALLGIYSSVSEHTESGRMNTLNKSFDMVMTGTKDIYERYSSSLGGPTMIVFSLGVILPVVLVSMLPLMDMGSSPFVFTLLVMNLVFPAGTFFYVRHIIQQRPGLTGKDGPDPRSTTGNGAMPAAAALPLFIIGILGYLGFLDNYMPGVPSVLFPLSAVWGLTVFISLLYYMRSRSVLYRHKQNRKMEEQFPDALHHIGAAMADGTPFDKAVSDTSITMAGTVIGRFLSNYVFRATASVSGNDHKAALLGSGVPRMVSSGLEMAKQADRLDSARAGRVVMKISRYIGDIHRLEKETKVKLGQTTSIIKTTAAIFAPLVLGVSASLYELTTSQMQSFLSAGLTSTTSETASASSLSAPAYVFIISLYLIQIGIILTYFVNGIVNDNSRVERDLLTYRTLPVSMGIFTASYLLSSVLI